MYMCIYERKHLSPCIFLFLVIYLFGQIYGILLWEIWFSDYSTFFPMKVEMRNIFWNSINFYFISVYQALKFISIQKTCFNVTALPLDEFSYDFFLIFNKWQVHHRWVICTSNVVRFGAVYDWNQNPLKRIN